MQFAMSSRPFIIHLSVSSCFPPIRRRAAILTTQPRRVAYRFIGSSACKCADFRNLRSCAEFRRTSVWQRDFHGRLRVFHITISSAACQSPACPSPVLVPRLVRPVIRRQFLESPLRQRHSAPPAAPLKPPASPLNSPVYPLESPASVGRRPNASSALARLPRLFPKLSYHLKKAAKKRPFGRF